MTTTEDTTAPAVEVHDWAGERAEGAAVIERMKQYLRDKANYSFDTSALPRELQMQSQGGSRASHVVAANLTEYIQVIDDAVARGLAEKAPGKTLAGLTDEEAVQVYGWAITRIKQKAIRLSSRDHLCDYGVMEFCAAVGTALPAQTATVEYSVTLFLTVPGEIHFGEGGRMTDAREHIEAVVNNRIRPYLARMTAKPEVQVSVSQRHPPSFTRLGVVTRDEEWR